MEIKVLEHKKNKLVLEVKGQGHSLCNALKAELLENPDVTVATYAIDHPLVAEPVLIVETNGKEEPKKALLDAAKSLKKRGEKFKEEFLSKVK